MAVTITISDDDANAIVHGKVTPFLLERLSDSIIEAHIHNYRSVTEASGRTYGGPGTNRTDSHDDSDDAPAADATAFPSCHFGYSPGRTHRDCAIHAHHPGVRFW